MMFHSSVAQNLARFVVCGILPLIFLIGSCGNNDDEDEIGKELPAPQGLEHTLARGKISLLWQQVEDAESYCIYRKDQDDQDFSKPIDIGIPAYDDTQVSFGNTYIYEVAAKNSKGIIGERSEPYRVEYPEDGELKVSPILVELGELLVYDDLELENIGGLILHWTLETRENWIALDKKEGDLGPQAEDVVSITVERNDKPGDYHGTVLARADTGQTIQITIEMSISAEPRIATVPPHSQGFIFEGTEQSHELTIKNIGTGILLWEIHNVPDWLALSPRDNVKGQTGAASPSLIPLTVSNSGQLQPGRNYRATLSLTSNDISNPELKINVILNVPAPPPVPPELSISNADKHVIFGPKDSGQSITIRNAGGGMMSWNVQTESTVSWLSIKPQQGKTEENGSDPLTFTVDREQGEPGKSLTTTVMIDAGDAGSQEIVIQVPIAGELWAISPASLTLEGSLPGKISIRNIGEGRLSWSGSSDDIWVTLGDKNGEIEPGETVSLQVSADLASLRLGPHTGKIQFRTKGGEEESVNIRLVKVAEIEGKILHSRSGALVPGVMITLDGTSSKTYLSGNFQIERLSSGAFHLEAEKASYLSAIFDGTVDGWGNVDPVRMWLRPIPQTVDSIADPARPFDAPGDICFSADGTRAFASDEFGSVFVIDALADAVMDQIQAGIYLTGIISNPQDDEIYVADAEVHEVIVLNTLSRKVMNRISVDKYPQQLAISQDGNWLYVTCRDSRSVVLIDTESRQVENRFSVGREPGGVALSPDGWMLYVANAKDNNVSVMNALTGHLESLVPVASQPQYLAASEDYVYVSNAFGDQVSVIDQASQKLVENIKVDNGILLGDLLVLEEPEGGDVIYVLDQTNNVIRLIDSVTFELVDKRIPLGDMPMALSIQPDLAKIYVINSGSTNISVLEF